jgi:hypothetical protein
MFLSFMVKSKNNHMKKDFFFLVLTVLLGFGCKQKSHLHNVNDAEIIHQNIDQVTQVIIYDIFSPPVASRIYAYTSLAAYEAIRFARPDAPSFAAMLNGFDKMPAPDKNKSYNYTLASSKAFFTVAHKLVFAIDSLKAYEDSLFNVYKESMDDSAYNRSVAFGELVGNIILARADKDNYALTRSMPKYLGSHESGKWQPTPPDYMDGVEPYWNKIKTFALDSAAQYRPGPPPAFSKDILSDFYKEVKELYNINKHITDEQKNIARFWDDNAFIVEHSGHLMYATKKITPGGHWVGITTIACKKSQADAVKSAQAYALTSMALLDAFIACWDSKYTYNFVRPVTVINEMIEKNWDPILQTPAHPEYSCGHCTISGSASAILNYLFGENFAFHDNSDEAYIGMTRDFKSFDQAAEEAGISRLYGGIHYSNSIKTGLVLGRKVGAQVLHRLQLK